MLYYNTNIKNLQKEFVILGWKISMLYDDFDMLPKPLVLLFETVGDHKADWLY